MSIPSELGHLAMPINFLALGKNQMAQASFEPGTSRSAAAPLSALFNTNELRRLDTHHFLWICSPEGCVWMFICSRLAQCAFPQSRMPYVYFTIFIIG